MTDQELRSKVIRLAKANPHLRSELLPLVKQARLRIGPNIPFAEVRAQLLKDTGLPLSSDKRSVEIDSPTVSSVVVGGSRTGTHGQYGGFEVSAVTTAGKRNYLEAFKFPKGVHYNWSNTKSWWYDSITPAGADPRRLPRMIQPAYNDAVAFVKRFAERASRAAVSGDLQVALKLNRALRLGIDEGALSKLFAAMEA